MKKRANRTIQTALARAYHQDKKEFDLNSSLVDILTAHNNNIHTTTKVAPSIAFKLDPEKENDKQLLTWIHENKESLLKIK